EPTNGNYEADYSLTGVILVTDMYSPAGKLRRLHGSDYKVEEHLPLLHTLSDASWFEWDALASNPKVLRYYVFEGITNAATSRIMDEIIEVRRGPDELAWSQRLTFDLSSDEGKALFGCPNGIAVNWLLIHHGSVLGEESLGSRYSIQGETFAA
ncbi:MAG: hypothetical protein Q9200_002877, partial [Gallowayella weberi]